MDNNPTMLVDFSDKKPHNLQSKEWARELYDGLLKTIWVIKLSYIKKYVGNGKKAGSKMKRKKWQRYLSGVCIGSKGYIITSSKGIEALYEELVTHGSIYGRTYGSEYKELKVEASCCNNMAILRVMEDSTTMYHYVDPIDDSGLVRPGSDLFVIGHDGDDAFSYANGHALAHLTTFQEIVANDGILPDVLPYPDDDPSMWEYIPIQVMRYVRHGRYLKRARSNIVTSISGSAVFDLSGRLVGIISMGLQDITFATPFDIVIFQKFDEYVTNKTRPVFEKGITSSSQN